MKRTITTEGLRYHIYNSGNPGPRFLILGAVHGNELVGPNTIERLVNNIENGSIRLAKGSLHLVPICNPIAYAQRKRFQAVNLNRIFNPAAIKKYLSNPETEIEANYARIIYQWIRKSDVTVDLHSTTEPSIPVGLNLNESSENIRFTDSLGIPDIVLHSVSSCPRSKV